MKLIVAFFALSWTVFEAKGYPYPYYGSNFDTISYGSSDSNRGGVVMSRYYNPYYSPRGMGAGMAAFMFKPEEQYHQPQSSQYYVPDRRRQTTSDNAYVPPQQNEVYYPLYAEQPAVLPEQPVASEQPALPDLPAITERTEVVEPTEKIEIQTTTLKAIAAPEITEPETEEVPKPVTPPKKRVTKKKQVKNQEEPVEVEEEEEHPPKMPAGAFFPMFFGYGRSGNAPAGATAIANAFSTGRGGVATSHATAYGPPQPEQPQYKS